MTDTTAPGHLNATDAPSLHQPGTTIGVLGGSWRADVTRWGAIRGWDPGIGLDWWVAADDRWHDPSIEPSVRQVRIEGTPVVETRLRVPRGDVIQRIYAVADAGGCTVIELENDSPLPVAVVVSGVPVSSVRPPADMALDKVPADVMRLPAGAVGFPIGHHSGVTLAIAHHRPTVGAIPGGLATHAQVVRGWTATCDRASRLLLPDDAVAQAVVSARCELLLAGPVRATEHPVDLLLGVGELVRMGGSADDWMPEVAVAVGRLHAHHHDPMLMPALDAAERTSRVAGETRAVRDLARVRSRLRAAADHAAPGSNRSAGASAARVITSVERSLVDGAELFPLGIPSAWFGQNFEAYDLPTSARSSVSLAVRWHGARPAVLWECEGAAVVLRSGVAAPEWCTEASTG